MAGTRPRNIRIEEGLPPKIIHDIDQFHWYKDIIERTSELEKNPEKELNAVRFSLPYVPGREPIPYVVVVGNGFDICNVYLIRVNWGIDTLTGRMPNGASGLWKIFSYSERGRVYYNKDRKLEIISTEKGLPMRLGNIFTTDISPFLKGGNSLLTYPLECDRTYNFGLWGFDQLKVIARNRKNRDEQNLEIVWAPDSRDCPEESLVILKNSNWTSPEVVQALHFTDQFTFPNSVNSDSL